MIRIAQGETYRPAYLEGHTGVTAVGTAILRMSDGYWYDFNDSTFKNAGWTTAFQSLSEEANPDASGLSMWINTTGFTAPADDQYEVLHKVTDATGSYYSRGETLIVALSQADAVKISGSADAADNLEASAETIVVGAAATGTLSTTQMTTNLTEATDDHYNGRIITWTDGALVGQQTDITDYDGATKILTFTAVTEAPSDGDGFVIT